jgi:hypothetical protein
VLDRTAAHNIVVNTANRLNITISSSFLLSSAARFKDQEPTLLVTSLQREADNKTRASRGLNPHVTAVVENSLAGEREP